MVGGCARLVNMHVKRADGPVETVERDLSEYETRILLQALEYWDDCGRPLDDRSLEAFPLGSKEVETPQRLHVVQHRSVHRPTQLG